MTGIRRSVGIDVAAPPSSVWDLVSEVTRMGQWSPECTGAEWLSGVPGQVGARFRGSNRRGRATWSTTCEVLESERGRVFTFCVGKPARPDVVWRYELTPLGERGTRVEESFELARPLSRGARLLTRVTTGVRDREADLEDGMRQTLSRLAAAAQQEGAAPLP